MPSRLSLALLPLHSATLPRAWHALLTALLLAALGGAAAAEPQAGAGAAAPDLHAVLADPSRTDEDRAADERRKPLELLEFAQVRPGQNVLDLATGGGYTTQLLALAVGPGGSVWAQGESERGLAKRLAAHPQANVHPLLRPYSDPYPADAPRLDLITFILNYHDVANTPTDRAVMDRKLFEALKPGGHLVVVDHATQPGRGVRDTKTLHRIDEQTVLDELQQAGFVLETRGDFLRAPADPRNQPFWDVKGATDRFALRLRRP